MQKPCSFLRLSSPLAYRFFWRQICWNKFVLMEFIKDIARHPIFIRMIWSSQKRDFEYIGELVHPAVKWPRMRETSSIIFLCKGRFSCGCYCGRKLFGSYCGRKCLVTYNKPRFRISTFLVVGAIKIGREWVRRIHSTCSTCIVNDSRENLKILFAEKSLTLNK